MDYFYFKLYQQSEKQRSTWAGTGYMYEYQRMMNPPSVRDVLADKLQFLQKFRLFAKRDFSSLNDLATDKGIAQRWLTDYGDQIVLKNSRGQVGAQVEVVETKGFKSLSLVDYMRRRDFDLVEEFVVQHDALMKLSSSGLNTVRLVTQVDNSQVIVLAGRLRVSVNSSVDNLAAGNLAAPIDIDSGVVIGPGIYSDITKGTETHHPVTRQPIVGFVIPFWQEALSMVRAAALTIPENRSVGWDIAITNQGPLLIEGNHNWCKLLWQLPVHKGLKHELDQFKK